MRHGRLITTGLAAVAAMAIAPALAAAAPASFVDDTAADFTAGTPSLGVSVVAAPGSVRLAPEDFNGTSLPASLTGTSGVTVANGSVTVDGGRVSGGLYSPGEVLTFRATFFTETYEQVGFADMFADGKPWAMFSFDGTGLSARTTHAGPTDDASTPVAGVDPTGPHNYRIAWSATDVKYYVDDVLVATHNVAIADQMRPTISDPGADGNHVSVDSLGLQSGTFESQVHDLGEAPAVWHPLSATVDQPSATQVSLETRSGSTPTPDATWSAYQPLGAGSAIQSPLARYLQYRAKLSTTDAQVTPSLDSVQLDYTAPTTSLVGVQVSGTAAAVSFASPASDVARFECSIDGGAFAACSSPLQLTGLAAGTHAVSVRAVDTAGNIGDADAKSFVVDNPPSGGGGTGAQQPSGGSSVVATADKTAPKVSVVVRSSRISTKGTISFRVGCPKTETSCKVTVVLKRGSSTVARKTVTVKSGETVTVTLQLTKAVRRQLAKHRTLKLSSVATATDAAGNRRTTTRPLTVRAPSA